MDSKNRFRNAAVILIIAVCGAAAFVVISTIIGNEELQAQVDSLQVKLNNANVTTATLEDENRNLTGELNVTRDALRKIDEWFAENKVTAGAEGVILVGDVIVKDGVSASVIYPVDNETFQLSINSDRKGIDVEVLNVLEENITSIPVWNCTGEECLSLQEIEDRGDYWGNGPFWITKEGNYTCVVQNVDGQTVQAGISSTNDGEIVIEVRKFNETSGCLVWNCTGEECLEKK